MERIKKVNESPETTPNEIESFLRDLNLTELIGIFQREQLTMEDILEMNNNELQSIGVEKHKQRKAILQVCNTLSKAFKLLFSNPKYVGD